MAAGPMRPQLPARIASTQLARTGRDLATFDDLNVETGYSPMFDMRKILRSLYRNRWLICGTIGACLALGLLAILISPRIYRATVQIAILPETDSPLGDVGSKSSLQPPADVERRMQTQVDLLRTRDMATAVLRRIAAAGDAQTRIAKDYSPRRLKRNLSVLLPRNSQIVPIAFDDTNPRVAAMIANAYAETLIAYNLQAHYNATAYARDFLRKQLAVAKVRLEQSDRALLQYARSAGLLDVGGYSSVSTVDGNETGLKSLTTSDLVQLNSAYSQARAVRMQAEQRWQQAMSTPIMSLPEVLSNNAVQSLNQQRAEIQAKLSENQTRYGDAYPPLQQARANIAELDRQIATIANSVKTSIRDQYQVAARQERALAGGVGQLKGQTLAEQDRAVRYKILQRETDTNRQLYDGLLQRFKQVSAESGVTSNNISVVDRAYPPEHPISPNPIKYLSLAAVLGSILAFVLVFLRERLDNRVNDPEWIDQDITVRLLGMIPRLDSVEPRDAILDPHSPMAEACHSLRTSIELHCLGAMPRSILFTSSTLQEGKSTTSLGLAHSFADAGERVLLIDGDLRQPSVHQLIAVDNDHGFADVLAGTMPLRDAIIQSDLFKLDVLTSGPRPASPAALLNGDRVRAILADALTSYDRVIVDGPPTLGIADASRLAGAVEATIFVVKSGGVTKDEVRFALRQLESNRTIVIGAVLTMFDPPRLGAGYGYGYGYSYGELTAA
jgi:polysaccharide biosynthesis transport protein